MYRQRTSLPTPPGGGGGGGGGGSETLFSSGRLTYAGTVALPNFTSGTRKFAFIKGSPFAYDPLHDNYLMGCFDQHGLFVIRVSLPAPVPHPGDGTIDGVPEATVLMSDWVDIFDGQSTEHPDLSQGVMCGGCIVDGTDLWTLQEPRYNGAATQFGVLGRVDNTADLTSLNGDPPWEPDIHWHNLCRGGTLIPQDLANTHFGGRRLLCGVGTGIAQFMNRGPCAITMDRPSAPSQILTTQKLIYYANDDPYIWPATADPWDDSFQQMSQQWIEDGDDDWVVQTGIVTLGNYDYKKDVGCGLIDGPVGFPYYVYGMTWHVDQLAAAAAGTIQPNQQTPREIVDLSEHFVRRNDPCLYRHSHGSAWNATLRRLWVMEPRGNDEVFDDLPLLHAYDLAA